MYDSIYIIMIVFLFAYKPFFLLQVDVLSGMIDIMEILAKKTLIKSKKKSDDDLVIGQAALYGLKVLCRILGEQKKKRFVKVKSKDKYFF